MNESEYNYYQHLIDYTNDLNVRNLKKPVCHDNVVCYYNFFTDYDNLYIVMEYVEGMNLYEYYKYKHGKINIKEIIEIIYQIINGLIYLHSIGVIHRDIKMENILIGKDKSIKIADYGISCFIDIENSCSIRKGIPENVSPQVLNKNLIKNATDEEIKKIYISNDIWALGILFFILCNHYHPFYDEEISNDELIYNIKYNNIQSNYNGSYNMKYNNELINTIINKMLEKDINKRPNLFQILSYIEYGISS